jgi:hypothetical protein
LALSNPDTDGARGDHVERPAEPVAQPPAPGTRRARREAEAEAAAASVAAKRSYRSADAVAALPATDAVGTHRAERAVARKERGVARRSARTARRLSGHRPGRTLATVLVVPALVGTLALPAYALAPAAVSNEASEQFSLSVAEAQDVDVSTFAASAQVSKAGYAAVSAEEIRAAAEAAERAAREQEAAAARAADGGGSYAVLAEQAEGDDYPWWYETPDDYGGGLSPLRYYFRECVDFVAWRLNRDAGVTSAPWKWDWASLGAGSAYSWADAWHRKGWPVSSEPVVGSVAYFNYNHVAYVQSIPGDGTVIIEEYNQNSDHSYHVRQIAVGEAMYLYPPG